MDSIHAREKENNDRQEFVAHFIDILCIISQVLMMGIMITLRSLSHMLQLLRQITDVNMSLLLARTCNRMLQSTVDLSLTALIRAQLILKDYGVSLRDKVQVNMKSLLANTTGGLVQGISQLNFESMAKVFSLLRSLLSRFNVSSLVVNLLNCVKNLPSAETTDCSDAPVTFFKRNQFSTIHSLRYRSSHGNTYLSNSLTSEFKLVPSESLTQRLFHKSYQLSQLKSEVANLQRDNCQLKHRLEMGSLTFQRYWEIARGQISDLNDELAALSAYKLRLDTESTSDSIDTCDGIDTCERNDREGEVRSVFSFNYGNDLSTGSNESEEDVQTVVRFNQIESVENEVEIESGERENGEGARALVPVETRITRDGEYSTVEQGRHQLARGGEYSTVEQGRHQLPRGGEYSTVEQGRHQLPRGGEYSTVEQGRHQLARGGEYSTVEQGRHHLARDGEYSTVEQGRHQLAICQHVHCRGYFY